MPSECASDIQRLRIDAEVDDQRLLSCVFAASSSCMQSSVLCTGVDRSILASTSLDLQMALTFSLGSPLNAGEVRRDANTATAANAETFFISTSRCARNERENPSASASVPAPAGDCLCEAMFKNFLTLIDERLSKNTSKHAAREFAQTNPGGFVVAEVNVACHMAAVGHNAPVGRQLLHFRRRW